jgi:GNAT superfamily N-acetyltransferase
MIVRPATAADAAALVPLFEQLGYPAPQTLIATRLETLDARAAVLVAEEEAKVIGFVAVSARPDFIEERAVVEGLVVEQNARNRGAGAHLLGAAEAWAATAGATAMLVRSNVVRDDAHRFYERQGYRRRKSQHIFEKALTGGRR